MSNPANSIKFFGVYLAIFGVLFFVVPNSILPLLGFATTTEPWIRLTGLLAAILGFYFLYSVRHNDAAFSAPLYTPGSSSLLASQSSSFSAGRARCCLLLDC